jgi:hypothetical protein
MPGIAIGIIPAPKRYRCEERKAHPGVQPNLPSAQKPNENPVVKKNFARSLGPANSVPTPASSTIRGVS